MGVASAGVAAAGAPPVRPLSSIPLAPPAGCFSSWGSLSSGQLHAAAPPLSEWGQPPPPPPQQQQPFVSSASSLPGASSLYREIAAALGDHGGQQYAQPQYGPPPPQPQPPQPQPPQGHAQAWPAAPAPAPAAAAAAAAQPRPLSQAWQPSSSIGQALQSAVGSSAIRAQRCARSPCV